ncbi:hypothetical protein K0M31_000281 [Melipona bicolor]|uniref:Uncharacterized protein n=1 Tax=Melipona bicolor TaxID=60889 RepID=A0AA40KWK0_9HYME|nr:hypothetical protein K0M31_000281 [Melipona bicolor]
MLKSRNLKDLQADDGADQERHFLMFSQTFEFSQFSRSKCVAQRKTMCEKEKERTQ